MLRRVTAEQWWMFATILAAIIISDNVDRPFHIELPIVAAAATIAAVLERLLERVRQ